MSRRALERAILVAFGVAMISVPWLVPALLGSFWVSVIAEIDKT